MDDRARLDERYVALCQRLEELDSQVSELEELRDRLAEAERAKNLPAMAQINRAAIRAVAKQTVASAPAIAIAVLNSPNVNSRGRRGPELGPPEQLQTGQGHVNRTARLGFPQ